jgi:outer membrane protein assembly factor BamA
LRISVSTFLLILFVFSVPANGQILVTDSNAVRILPVEDSPGSSKGKDIVDVFRQWLGYKTSSKSDNIKPGDKPVISVLPAAGYTLQTKLAAILSGNIAFFTSDKPGSKLSVVTANTTYTQNKQFTIPIQLNVWLKGDEWNLLGDWRYMKYPQSTFGLGSDSKLDMENPMNYKYIRVYQYVLKKITPDFSAGLGYTLDYHWNISEKGLDNSGMSDYAEYGEANKTVSSGLALNVLYDTRKNPINPSQGLSAGLVVRNNAKWLGSNSNWQSAILDIRKYVQLPGHSKNVLAFWSYNWMVFGGKPPYLDLPSTGWDNFNNTGRGFIQGRFRGDIMLYAESEYRFRLTQNGLFGGVVFLNAESFSGAPSKKLQSIQPGTGLGLRIKLNKKSNTNIAIDYGFGTQGMKGLFVNVGEVF